MGCTFLLPDVELVGEIRQRRAAFLMLGAGDWLVIIVAANAIAIAIAISSI